MPGLRFRARAEVVDEDFAVDLGCVEGGAALPEQFGFFRLAFDQQVDLAADPGFLLASALICFWIRISLRRRSISRGGTFCREVEGFGALFVGVAEDAQPVDLRLR